jgi:hypothetical protein
MPDDRPPRPSGTDAGWGFAILAAVIAVILTGWGWAGQGRGWGRSNQMAHMMPPAVSSTNGPATRAETASMPSSGR